MTHFALSACGPDLYSAGAGADLGGFCCIEHADAEARPSRDHAERVYAESIVDCGDIQCVTTWRRLLDVYPAAIPVKWLGEAMRR